MHDLVGIYNKRTTEVFGVRCNGKAQGRVFFPPIQKFVTSPIPTSLFIYTHTHVHTPIHSHSFSTLQYVPQGRAPSC